MALSASLQKRKPMYLAVPAVVSKFVVVLPVATDHRSVASTRSPEGRASTLVPPAVAATPAPAVVPLLPNQRPVPVAPQRFMSQPGTVPPAVLPGSLITIDCTLMYRPLVVPATGRLMVPL